MWWDKYVDEIMLIDAQAPSEPATAQKGFLELLPPIACHPSRASATFPGWLAFVGFGSARYSSSEFEPSRRAARRSSKDLYLLWNHARQHVAQWPWDLFGPKTKVLKVPQVWHLAE